MNSEVLTECVIFDSSNGPSLDPFAMMRAIEKADHCRTLFISLKTQHPTEPRPEKGKKKDPAIKPGQKP
ncbi:MAG: hypothetical protein ACRYF8_18345 [Janthinobacterium lividum]